MSASWTLHFPQERRSFSGSHLTFNGSISNDVENPQDEGDPVDFWYMVHEVCMLLDPLLQDYTSLLSLDVPAALLPQGCSRVLES